MARCEDWPCCGHEAGSCPSAYRNGREVQFCECGHPVCRKSNSLCIECYEDSIDYPDVIEDQVPKD